jgi:histidine triad (HIT) family protein
MAADSQCIFCKIVSGEIPSKKVFETPLCVALLDINPATKGHVLLMPKDHFMILPQVPAETMKDLTLTSKKVADLVFKAFKPTGLNIFAANGQVAGQKAPHVMIHIIPRYDGVSMKLTDKETKSAELDTVFHQLQPALSAAFGTSAVAAAVPSTSAPELKMTEQDLLKMIEDNPKIKEYILRDPVDFAKKLESLPQLAGFFKGFDIAELRKKLGGQEEKQASYETIVGLLADNPQLKEMLINTPDKLIEAIAKTPQLQMVFKGYDIHELSKKIKGGSDLDKISKLFP